MISMNHEEQLETQRNIILNLLKSGKEVSSWLVIQRYGITRLAKYINDFRKEGMNIPDRWEQAPTSRYKVYWLGEMKS